MNAVTDNATLLPAWNDSVHDAQAVFRCVLKALSEPGLVIELPLAPPSPPPLHAATTALCLSLLDFETPVWLDQRAGSPAVAGYLRFHCGAPIVEQRAQAAFAVIADPQDGLNMSEFSQGELAYPDRSATLLLQVDSLSDGEQRILRGPGIAGTRSIAIAGLPAGFEDGWRQNAAQFPLGVDIVFCCGRQILGLPRSSQFSKD
ncbi:MAG: phosphonate C-P lyase system protein PhnH [Pseudomonadota bacterium]